MTKNFAMAGVAGHVAPRHLQAIADTGNRLVAAMDPHDAVGILDQYSLDVRFFTEFERFDRHLEKLRRGPESERVDFLSICSPNYLHDAHIRLALRVGAHAICEKPLVINPWNLDGLEDLAREAGASVYTILQVRLHPVLIALRQKLEAESSSQHHDVCLTYITARGRWYNVSWKGSEERSGGLVTNIGIHFFDLLVWLFGPAETCEVHLREPKRVAGFLQLQRATVRWFLSAELSDLPVARQSGHRPSFRSLSIDGEEVEFSDGFADLHTHAYRAVLDGQGLTIQDARPSIELAYRIRQTPVSTGGLARHPHVGALG